MASPVSHLSLWETAKSELRNIFSRTDYDTWISSLNPVSIVEGNVLLLEAPTVLRSEEHTSELQSHHDLVCRLLLAKNT